MDLFNEPLVSVLIPVFNVEKFVIEAIVSIQNQTYRNLEIIVIDDCSTDKTYNIVKSIALKDKRIKLVKNKKNLKISKTLNKALNLSTGKYIARMDGDDISDLERIEKKVRFLQANKEFDLIGCSMKAIDIDGNKIGESIHFANEQLLKKTLKLVTPVSHIWVAKRSLYLKLNGYRNVSGVEDYDFLLRMTTLGYRYTNLENYYGYYVRLGRNGNTISTYGVKQIKLHSYVYRLFKERERSGVDSFNEVKIFEQMKSNYYLEKVHSKSASFLLRSIAEKEKQNYLSMLFFLIVSLISPYQVMYLIKRFEYRRIIKKHTK